MSFRVIIQRFHLWVGLLLGIQVFLWLLSGLVMTWFHINLVRGETNSFQAPPQELEAAAYASPGGVIAQMDGVTSVELRGFRGRPVYEVHSADGAALFDAASGEKLTPINERLVRAIAEDDFVPEADLVRIRLMSETPHEYRRELPVWRADFDDRLNTRIYISPTTGKVVSRRNDIWRIFDFFWMLHIMDYVDRENFNTWWVQLASLIGTLFAASGLVMVVMKSGRRQLSADVRTIQNFAGLKKKKARQS